MARILRCAKLCSRWCAPGAGNDVAWRVGKQVDQGRLETCFGCGAAKAKLPLHVRTYECDACHLVIDRDANAARNLAALAAACMTGTGVAGDQDTPKRVSKPRGADQKTRATRPRRTAEAGRAGGATLPHQRQTESRDPTQAEPLRLW
ncbi:zinc ribbon domain-containing protein [Streptomyces adustus]|uniref:zinc ribbon domain-containing protein n=1 Tax=Streptomyces adustus TaxID=1609272 RepID=UPI001EE4897E|nr:zinc ribbon domain-containing protein [Streptomyces adustus]